MGIFLKDPAATLDYAIDWSAAYLGAATVTASDWTVEPVGLTVTATLGGPAKTAAVLGGGVAGRVYRVANRVVLSDGRHDERSLTLRVEDR